MNEQSNPNESSKLHIDSDWKQQARAEKQKLQEQVASKEGEASGPGQMPPADFKTLVSTLVSQALLYMGAIPEPSTGQRIAHPELARHHIDMLGVIEEKTKGNLDEEEQQLLTQALHELRSHFTEFAKQVAAHQARQGQQDVGRGPEGTGGGPSLINPNA